MFLNFNNISYSIFLMITFSLFKYLFNNINSNERSVKKVENID